MILRLNPAHAAIVLTLAAACLTTNPAQAQTRQELASRLVQLQVRVEGPAIVEQLTANAVQPLVAVWAERLHQLPQERQASALEQLDAELDKFRASTQQAIAASLAAAAEAALTPIFMERLSEDDLKIIIAYMESPASAKMQELAADASNAWASAIIDGTRGRVETGMQVFDTEATRIVNSATAPQAGRPQGK